MYANASRTVLDLLSKFDPHSYLKKSTDAPGAATLGIPDERQAQTEDDGHLAVFSVDLLCVAREWRGSGIARVIADHLNTLMRAARPMIALTVATNVRSQRLMKGKGYDVVGETDFRREYIERWALKYTPQEDDPQCIKLMAMRC